MGERRVLVLGLAATAGFMLLPILGYSASATRTPQQVWDGTCHACHDTGAAPVILGQHIPPDRVKAIVRNGGLQMPPIGTDQVSDDELEALAAWVSAHDAPKGQ
ncbi:MAG TPA: cytochrome c [Alphaproteobacteria bacterium]|nr:cytochrome c [Alphaproteobacteria bacterium]